MMKQQYFYSGRDLQKMEETQHSNIPPFLRVDYEVEKWNNGKMGNPKFQHSIIPIFLRGVYVAEKRMMWKS